MMMDRHDSIGAKLDEYALGQLSADERRDVERHVRECDVCAADLRELTVVMEGLAHVPDPVTPPPALRQRVLTALISQPQEAPRIPGDHTVIATRGPVIRRLHPAWLAAAAVLVLALASLLYSTNHARRQLAGEVRRAGEEASALQRQLDEYAGQADLAVSILTASDMQSIAMAGRETAAASTARAYWSPTRGLLIVADQLPVPPPGRVYQVWIIGSGQQPVSAGLLGEQGSGRGMLIAPPPGGVAPGALTVAVTDEPPGGLSAPSGTIRLAGSL